MRPANVLEPVLASISDDPEHPSVKSTPDFSQVLISLDEADLEDVLSDVRASGHAESMAVERVAVAGDQDSKRVAVTREDALDNELIGVVPIHDRDVGARDGFRRLHDERVTHCSPLGQYVRRVISLE